MQHLPHHSLEDLESSRADMQAFRKNLRKEKHVWPDLTLTGQDIHTAYLNACPEFASKRWDDVEEVAKEMYRNIAKELNRELDGRQAWFEGEDVTISSVRCPQCKEMLQAEHAEGHACWIKEVR